MVFSLIGNETQLYHVVSTTRRMVGSKRCYLCDEEFVRGDEIIVCEECGVRFHASCVDDRVEEHCPRCADEGWISAMEF